MRKKYKYIFLFIIMIILFISNDGSNHAPMLYTYETASQSQEAINRFKNAMYELSFVNPQEDKYVETINKKSEQYKTKANFNIRVLLYDSLLRSLELLGLIGAIYILNMRDKVVNYLLAIIYIHKSDGQKEGKHILLIS